MTTNDSILETERLVLRCFSENDIPSMATISADKHVMRYFPAAQTADETVKLVRKIIAHQKAHGYSLYAVEHKASNTFIGWIGLAQPSFKIPGFIPVHLPIVEIGWRLSSTYWGKGFATEGAQAVLDHAFNTIGLKEIISFTAKTNVPSIRVMEKIGLSHHKEDDFMHPKLPNHHPLQAHILYRKSIGS